GLGSIPFTMSMRMCSLDRRVHGEHSRKIIPNSTHCNSSQAFDDVSNSLRTVALVAEMMTTIRISQDSTLPIRKLSASMKLLSLSKPATCDPPGRSPVSASDSSLRGLALAANGPGACD